MRPGENGIGSCGMKVIKLFFIVQILLALSGCERGEEDGQSDASQVAAKVNSREITVHKLNHVLKSARLDPGSSVQEISNKVLDKLINEEIILQKAEKLNLERNPDVLLAIEMAKERVLIEEFLTKVIPQPSIKPSEVKQYFDDHPKLFSDRKIFTYSKVLVNTKEDQAPVIKDLIDSADEIDELLTKIDDAGAKYQIVKEKKGSEELPKPLLEPMYKLTIGDIGFLTSKGSILILQIDTVEDAPLDFDAVKQTIENYLIVESRNNQIKQLVSELRDQAQVEYIGEFEPVE